MEQIIVDGKTKNEKFITLQGTLEKAISNITKEK